MPANVGCVVLRLPCLRGGTIVAFVGRMYVRHAVLDAKQHKAIIGTRGGMRLLDKDFSHTQKKNKQSAERVCRRCEADTPSEKKSVPSAREVLKRGEVFLSLVHQGPFEFVTVTLTKENLILASATSLIRAHTEMNPAVPSFDEGGNFFCFEIVCLIASIFFFSSPFIHQPAFFN